MRYKKKGYWWWDDANAASVGIAFSVEKLFYALPHYKARKTVLRMKRIYVSLHYMSALYNKSRKLYKRKIRLYEE